MDGFDDAARRALIEAQRMRITLFSAVALNAEVPGAAVFRSALSFVPALRRRATFSSPQLWRSLRHG
jgi:hypothetical protein